MKRGLLLSVAVSLALGGWAVAQCGCPPTPEPEAPSCYVSFQQCQSIEIGLKVSSGFGFLFCCSPCCSPPGPDVYGWRVEDLDGYMIYDESLQDPVPARSFSAVWDQRDTDGELVAPGYYTVIVSTDEGDYEKHLRVLDRCQSFFSLFRFGAGCCSTSCGPEVTLERYTERCAPSPCTVSPCCP
ncbi:MAG: hypothetical protein R6U88_00035 [Candidatus Bipolaricaulota bacterium]